MIILIVEDSDLTAQAMQVVLERQEHEVVRARNGLEALQKLQILGNVDLIITDILMPEMDGLTLVRRLRDSTEYATLPIILCTAAADMSRVREAAELGCRHYLVKPVQPDDLLQRVEQAVGEIASD